MFLTKTAKSQFVSKIVTSVRRRGAPTAGCLQEIDQFLEVDPIADIQEAVGPVEVQMLPACRVRSLDRVGPLVILPTRPRARAAFNPASSLVTPNFFPISSRISGLPPSNPNRIKIILRSRSSNTSKSSLTKFVAHVPVSERLERRLRIFITDDLAKFG